MSKDIIFTYKMCLKFSLDVKKSQVCSKKVTIMRVERTMKSDINSNRF